MLIAKIDLRPYIKNPSLYITDSLLASLEEELRIYTNLAKTRPEYKKYISEIEKDIKDVKKWIKDNPINIKDKEIIK